MQSPLVSIIMAAYNHARYIEGAISSALAQTWHDWELIVVDDGSTDATARVVAQFGNRVRYIYQENRGQGAARNRGIAAARGEYVSFLDDDDLWAPEYLATVLSLFRREPDTAAVHTGFYTIDDEGTVLPQAGRRVVPPDRMYGALLRGGWFPPCCVTVRRACLDQVGPLDETLRGHDDWDLWIRIARDHVFRGVPDALAYYRVHGGGLSANIEHMFDDQKRAIARNFGGEEGHPTSWPMERRLAFAAAYRTAALGYLQLSERERGYGLLKRGLEIWPDLLLDLDTFYELALGDQPRGHRGEAGLVDLKRNGAEMLRWLDDFFASADPSVRALRGAAYGNAYLALAMLSDQAGDWSAARRYLLRAVRHHPPLSSASLLRRLAKLTAGKRAVSALRRLRGVLCGAPRDASLSSGEGGAN